MKKGCQEPLFEVQVVRGGSWRGKPLPPTSADGVWHVLSRTNARAEQWFLTRYLSCDAQEARASVEGVRKVACPLFLSPRVTKWCSFFHSLKCMITRLDPTNKTSFPFPLFFKTVTKVTLLLLQVTCLLRENLKSSALCLPPSFAL